MENIINWTSTTKDKNLILKIAKRAMKDLEITDVDLIDIQMDIAATHLNGCKLNLPKLLKADISTFGHDVNGISRHINRDTGKLNTRSFQDVALK